MASFASSATMGGAHKHNWTIFPELFKIWPIQNGLMLGKTPLKKEFLLFEKNI